MEEKSASPWMKKLTPAAPKSWLYGLAFLMWSGVGAFLCSLTIDWLKPVHVGTRSLFIGVGILLAILIATFGFSKFANKNILRIRPYSKKKICIFAFQQWSSYPLVISMIALGIFLRKYSPIPKPWLAILYIGIGGSLFLASFLYLREIIFPRKEFVS
jgi:uncharacterized membrane protein